MKKGLVLGKFLPLHKGHLGLIDFALEHCDNLLVLLCYTSTETVSEAQRLSWLEQCVGMRPSIQIQSFYYDTDQLPNTSKYSKESAEAWASKLKIQLPQIDILFTSEEYGAPVAQLMNIKHLNYDYNRKITPVSASLINSSPFQYWDYLPKPVQPFFVKKICIVGSESTGKSNLARNLAGFFNTTFVPEMAREIIKHTEECTYEHLFKIAELQAETILKKTVEANKMLFCDTDLNITKSYSRFLFNKNLTVPLWIEDANVFDLHIYLDNNCPYIQDGTRLSEKERDRLNDSHKQQLDNNNIKYITVSGTWDERFVKSCEIIQNSFCNQ